MLVESAIQFLIAGNKLFPVSATKIGVEIVVIFLGAGGGVDLRSDPATENNLINFLVEINSNVVTVWQLRRISPLGTVGVDRDFPPKRGNVILWAGEQYANFALWVSMSTHDVFLSRPHSLRLCNNYIMILV